jgi:hypothetical protein
MSVSLQALPRRARAAHGTARDKNTTLVCCYTDS